MTISGILVLIAQVTIGIIVGVFSAVLFYHIGRYSLVGDSSKRVFVYFVVFSAIVIAISVILIILNHLLS